MKPETHNMEIQSSSMLPVDNCVSQKSGLGDTLA